MPQYAPLLESIEKGVRRMILMSSQMDQPSIYLRSRRTMSLYDVMLLPITCQSPVTPGFASMTLRQCQRP